MIKLFDKGYVYFMWDEILRGKLCFAADSTDDLVSLVYEKSDLYIVYESLYPGYPFRVNGKKYRFVYFDPQYELKIAYNNGLQLQYRCTYTGEWIDCERNISPPFGLKELRIKPTTLLIKETT